MNVSTCSSSKVRTSRVRRAPIIAALLATTFGASATFASSAAGAGSAGVSGSVFRSGPTAPAARTDQAPAGSNVTGYVGLAFANRQIGALLQSSGPANGDECSLTLHGTVDGGRSWIAPLTFARGILCSDPAITGWPMAVTSGGDWWVATPKGLFHGVLGTRSTTRLDGSDLASNAVVRSTCGVVASGETIWVTLATTCTEPAYSRTELVRSFDNGRTWSVEKTFPLAVLAEQAAFVAQQTSMLASGASDLEAAGWTTLQRRFGPPQAVEVASTGDGGKSWSATTIPCPAHDSWAALLAGWNGRFALCLGLGSTGYNPMAVVAATPGNIIWTLQCANGPAGVAPAKDKCPLGGYPSGFLEASKGALVMVLSYTGTIDVSTDGGASWRMTYRSPYSFLTSARSPGTLWVLGVGPAGQTAVGAGPGTARLVYSSDGKTWKEITTPPLSTVAM
jgi:hypothetical protein